MESSLRALDYTANAFSLVIHEKLGKKTLAKRARIVFPMLHFMGEIFKNAVEDGLIEKDPTASRRIVIPSSKSYDREALPLEQFKEIISNLDRLERQDISFAILQIFFLKFKENSVMKIIGSRWHRQNEIEI